MVEVTEEVIERIKKRTHKNGECWEFESLGPAGYGQLSIKNYPYYTHRLSYAYHKGPIPTGLNVCHECDNPACWNPDHLFVGTDQDNHTDKVNKGRQPKGEDIHSSVLTEEIVIKLKNRTLKPSRSLALKLFGHKESSQLYSIRNGKSWKHLNHHIPS